MMSTKRLLIVYHSKSGQTGRMAAQVFEGATHEEIENVDTVMQLAFDTTASDLLMANALILGTPENFGYMSGAMKDFFDRTFYEVEGKISPLPYAVFISAGNDGTGALTAIQRIVRGYPFLEVQQPIIVNGHATDADLAQCQELGMAMAFGLDTGVF